MTPRLPRPTHPTQVPRAHVCASCRRLSPLRAHHLSCGTLSKRSRMLDRPQVSTQHVRVLTLRRGMRAVGAFRRMTFVGCASVAAEWGPPWSPREAGRGAPVSLVTRNGAWGHHWMLGSQARHSICPCARQRASTPGNTPLTEWDTEQRAWAPDEARTDQLMRGDVMRRCMYLQGIKRVCAYSYRLCRRSPHFFPQAGLPMGMETLERYQGYGHMYMRDIHQVPIGLARHRRRCDDSLDTSQHPCLCLAIPEDGGHLDLTCARDGGLDLGGPVFPACAWLEDVDGRRPKLPALDSRHDVLVDATERVFEASRCLVRQGSCPDTVA